MESGARDDRLDRLARDVEFIARLLKSDVEVTCCNLPGADRFVLHVMADVAESGDLQAHPGRHAGGEGPRAPILILTGM